MKRGMRRGTMLLVLASCSTWSWCGIIGALSELQGLVGEQSDEEPCAPVLCRSCGSGDCQQWGMQAAAGMLQVFIIINRI